MNVFLIAITLISCGLYTVHAVDILDLEDFYDQVAPEAWKYLLRVGVSKADAGPGRSGNAINEEFWAEKCKEVKAEEAFGDFCFIVQTSCLESEARRTEVLTSVKADIRDILTKANTKNSTSYTLVTYSKVANVAVTNSEDVDQVDEALDGKIGGTCDDCGAATSKALDACRQYFGEKPDDGLPRNIVIFTTGVSMEEVYNLENARQNTMNAAIQFFEKINIQVVKVHPTRTPVQITGDEEWNHLQHNLQVQGPVSSTVTCAGLGVNNDQVIKLALGEISGNGQTKEKCCIADVVFVLDKSDSIPPEDVGVMLEFLKNFTEGIEDRYLDPNSHDQTEKLQIGLFTYAARITRHARLGEFNKTGLIEVINSIDTTTKLYTQTHLALRSALSEIKRSRKENKARGIVRTIVVVMTDGRTFLAGAKSASNGKVTIKEADKLKREGIELYVVGLPNRHNKTDGYEREWKHMASEPINCTIVNMQEHGSFDKLIQVQRHLTEELCLNRKDDICRWSETRPTVKQSI